MDATLAARMNEITNDPVALYSWYGWSWFADCGEGGRVREARQQLADSSIDNAETQTLDAIVIEAAIANDYVSDDVMRDDAGQPLENWWWHLGKIRAKTYPAELLSAPLQEIYADTQNNVL